jgi:hypothetical protein
MAQYVLRIDASSNISWVLSSTLQSTIYPSSLLVCNSFTDEPVWTAVVNVASALTGVHANLFNIESTTDVPSWVT